MTTGSYEWGIKKGGNLSAGEKIKMSLQVIKEQFKRKLIRTKAHQKINIDPTNIQIPDSRLIRQTFEFIDDTHSPAIRNHCLRAYIFGELFGRNEKLQFDSEVYALAALLHDIGLEKDYCCLHPDVHCFAIEGAMEAGKYLSSQKLAVEKIKIIEDAIALHLNIKIPIELPEAYLLNKASATDTIGMYKNECSPSTITKLMEIHPRLTMVAEMNELLSRQSKIRPRSRMSFLYANGFGTMMQKAIF